MQHSLFQPQADTPNLLEVQDEIRTFLGHLYRALESASVVNRDYSERYCRGSKPIAYVREMIVRDQAIHYLKENGITIEDEFVLLNEPNRALIARCNGVRVRVLKAIDGVVPGCGHSRRRRRYYGQVPTTYLGVSGVSIQSKWNLLLLWDFDRVFNIGKVWLVYPLRGGFKSSDVVVAWSVQLEHPATQIVIQPERLDIAAQDERDLRSLLEEVEENEEERDDEASSPA